MISPSYQFVLTTLMVVLTKDIVIAETDNWLCVGVQGLVVKLQTSRFP